MGKNAVNMNQNIYKSFEMLNGTNCDIMVASFGDISKAMYQFNMQKDNTDAYDAISFIMKQICTFNGRKESIEYILSLPAECYLQISTLMNEILIPRF